jgi:uncharacterized membrane protein
MKAPLDASEQAPTYAVGKSTFADSKSRRLDGVDAARGVAMVLVCLSHFMSVYFSTPPAGLLGRIGSLTLVASPTFIALSGIMMGMLTTAGGERSRVLRAKLADRAVFLLVIGHAVLMVARMSPIHLVQPLRWFGPTFITDAIAVSILVALWLVPRASMRTRMGVGVAALAFAWSVVIAWHPLSVVDVGLKEILFGSLSYQYFPYSWPLVPWAGVYLICTALGEILGAQLREGKQKEAEQILLMTAASAFALALAWRVVGWRVHLMNPVQTRGSQPHQFFEWVSKWPPSPAYLLFFGGPGLGLLWLMLVCARRRWAKGALIVAARVGRCSLMVFVAQTFLYYKVVPMVHLAYTPWWPALFTVTLLPLYVLAWEWDKHQLNRILTVGLSHRLRRIEMSDDDGVPPGRVHQVSSISLS